MSKDKKGKGGDYEVGYGKPPKQHRFKKGKSGYPGGRPRKRKRNRVDAAAVLNEPLAVKESGVPRKMHPFEVSVRRLVEGGLKRKNLKAILEFLNLCESFRLLAPPKVEDSGGVVVAPKGMTVEKWLGIVAEWVPASSPNGEDDID